jgi:uncharacterized protein YqjF (DUF2071 family)
MDQRLAARVRPPGSAAMYQSWRELLFLHWRMPAEVVRPMIPEGLELDTWDGAAWLGVVPFFMKNIRPVWSPTVPGVSSFLELNLRTYVYDRHGTPGVWFFSLDANQRLAVWWARRFFHLPYFPARMRASADSAGRVRFESQRRGTEADQICRFEYAPAGAARRAEPGSFEFFLIERYFLFARSPKGVLWRGQVVHRPYEIADADLADWNTHLLTLGGFPEPQREPDHAVMSRGVDVEVFSLERIGV